MCVLPERQVNSAYFTYLIVIQVSVWQHRHFHPSLSFATAAASAGAAALFCSHRPASGPVSAPIPASLPRLPCRAPAPRPPAGLLRAGLAPASSSIFPCGGAGARASLGTDVPERWGTTRRGRGSRCLLQPEAWRQRGSCFSRRRSALPRALCPQPSPLAGRG